MLKRYFVQFVLFSLLFLAAPAGVLAADSHALSAQAGPNPGQVTLKWNHVTADVQNYNLVYGTEQSKFQYGAIGIGKTTSYVVSFLEPGRKYFFAISPVRGGRGQYISSQVAATAQPGIVTPPPAAAIAAAQPSAPQLVVKRGKTGEVTLQWSNNLGNADNYDIVYGTTPGKFQYGALNVGKVNSFTVKSLDSSKHYYFAIAPVKGGQAQYITPAVSDAGTTAATNNPTNSSSGSASSGSSGSSAGGSGSAVVAPVQTSGGTTTGTSTTTTTTSGTDSKKDDKKTKTK